MRKDLLGKDIEKRLKTAFREEWKQLSSSDKEKAISAYLHAIEPEQMGVRATIDHAFRRNIDFGLFFLAIGFGILIALFTDALIEQLKSIKEFLGAWYGVVLGGLVLIMLGLINNFFEEVVNRDLRDSKLLNTLLK